MRFTVKLIPLTLFLLFPFYMYWNEVGLIDLFLGYAGLLLLRQVTLLYPIFSPSKDHKLILESIHVSPYVEKVRWVLDYLQVEYEEEMNVGAFGLFFLGRRVPQLKIPSKDICISNSSDILRYIYAITKNDPKAEAFLNPSPEAIEMEKRFDDFMEDVVKKYLYSVLFSSVNVARAALKVWGIHQKKDIPLWQRQALAASEPLLRYCLSKRLNTANSKDAIQASVNAVKTEIAKFEKILDDGRNYLLGTESPTYVDFQLAAIMGLIIVIDEYGGGVIEPDSVLTPDERGPERVAVDKEIRETKLGKFALKMYREHRNAKRN